MKVSINQNILDIEPHQTTPTDKSSLPMPAPQSDELLRLIAENVEDYAIFAIDLDGNVASWNKGVEKLLGYAEHEFVGQDACIIFTPEDNERDACARETGVAQEHGRAEDQRWHLRKDNSLFWANGLMMTLRDNAGILRGYTKIMRDDTRRKLAEESQAESVRLAALSADVSVALTRNESLHATLRLCAEAMVLHLDAAFARIWTLDEAEQVLELKASAGIYTHLNGAHSRVPVGKFKIGLIAAEREPHLSNDVASDVRLGDQDWAAREGMVSFAGYPLIVGERLVGVMAMFARHALTQATLGAMESIANGVALGIERKRVEAERERLQQQIISAQEQRLAELSTPLLPLGRDILIMPLIGTVDESRAQQVLDTVAQGVVSHGARFVLIDITGVPSVDERVAGAIVQASQMVYLLGAEVVLTGIRAGVAHALGRLSVDLNQLVTRKTLRSGLEYAEQRLREIERNSRIVSARANEQSLA